MCIGLFGYGYWVVSRDLRRYPLRTMWTNVFNDFIWLPFFLAYFVWYRKQGHGVQAASRG